MSFATPCQSRLPRALRHRNFALYTAGNSFSLIGMWVQRLALGWLVWELTGSGAWLGLVAFAEFLPNFFITPFGGVLADRVDRRKLIIVVQSLAGLQAAILCALTAFDLITAPLIVILSVYSGIVFAFGQAARLALVPSLIPRADLASAIAITSVIFNVARFLGPALAGIVISYFGLAAAFGLNAASYLTIIAALLALRLPPHRPSERTSATLLTQVIADFVEGWRYTVSHRAIAVLILLLVVDALLARSIGDLLPGFVDDLFARGPGGLAILTSSMGIGAILAGLLLANRRSTLGLTTATLGSVCLNGLAIMVFASAGHFWVAVVAIALSGFANVTSGTGSQTLIQSVVEDRVRGRVMGLWSLTIRGGPALGAVVLGWLTGYFGFALPMALGGLATAGTALLALRRRKALRARLEPSPPP